MLGITLIYLQDEVTKLGKLFNENFEKYADQATDSVKKAGPQL